MKLMRFNLAAALVFVTAFAVAAAQDVGNQERNLQWHVSVTPAQAKPGDEVEVVFSAEISRGWILYSSDFNLEIGPRPTRFTFDAGPALALLGPVHPVKPQWKNDKSLGGKYSFFANHAEFRQKARLVSPLDAVSGRIEGQTCLEESGLCKLFRETFSTTL